MRKYTPRRASKRWLDGDCPAGVLAIFDHPNTFDRYTVIYRDVIESHRGPILTYVGASEHPFHPQGFGQHGEMEAHEAATFRYANNRHACKWSDLPPDVQRLVRRDLSQLER